MKFKFPANKTLLIMAGNLNFKLRIGFWNISFLRFGDQKNSITLSEKKSPLVIFVLVFCEKKFERIERIFKTQNPNLRHNQVPALFSRVNPQQFQTNI